jgi:hypothetical protein
LWLSLSSFCQLKIALCEIFAEIETEIAVFTNSSVNTQIILQILCQSFDILRLTNTRLITGRKIYQGEVEL